MTDLRDLVLSLVDHATCAAIVGNERGVWAAMPGFFPPPGDIQTISKAFSLSPKELNRGIVFQNEAYLVTHNRDGTIIARNSAGSIALCRCPNCTVFASVEASMQFDECLRRTQKLAEVIAATPEAELL
jgi:hypothetical protein